MAEITEKEKKGIIKTSTIISQLVSGETNGVALVTLAMSVADILEALPKEYQKEAIDKFEEMVLNCLKI